MVSTESAVVERVSKPVMEPAVRPTRDTHLEKLVRSFEPKPVEPLTVKPKLRFLSQREPFAFD